MPGTHVIVNLKQLEAFRRRLEDAEYSSGPIYDAWIQVAVRYRAFVRAHFRDCSRGGGEWPPLAESTIRGRTRAPVARALAALRKGPRLTEAQYNKRLKAAKLKAARHWNKYLKGEARFSILINTGLLFAATKPVFMNAPGQLQEFLGNGIEVGFGGPGRYPDGNATIADVAAFHQRGGGRLPQRRILIEPDTEVLRDIAMYLQRGVNRSLRGRS